MVNVVVLVEVKEGHMDFVKEQIKLLKAETIKESGCISYCAYESTSNANTICFAEKWESQELFDKHVASEHIKVYRENTADMFLSRNLNFLNEI